VRSAFVSKRAPVDRLVQSEAIKLYPGWSKVVGAPLALYEPRTWISDLAPEGDRTPEPRNVQGRRFDVTQMPHRKAIFQRTVIDSAVDQPDSLFGELTKGSRPARAGQHRKVSTPVSGSDFARSTSGSRVPTWSVAKAWTPTQSTSAACIPVGTRATELRPVRFHGRWPPRGVAVTLACARLAHGPPVAGALGYRNLLQRSFKRATVARIPALRRESGDRRSRSSSKTCRRSLASQCLLRGAGLCQAAAPQFVNSLRNRVFQSFP